LTGVSEETDGVQAIIPKLLALPGSIPLNQIFVELLGSKKLVPSLTPIPEYRYGSTEG